MQITGMVCGAGSVLIVAALLLYHSVFIYGARQGWPVVTPIVQMLASKERMSQERYLKENLDAMARKLGELQARMVQLDSLSQRVTSLAGLPASDLKNTKGSGGPLVRPETLTLQSVRDSMDAMDEHAVSQSDRLEYVESKLFAEKMRKSMLPTSEPVQGGVLGSGFGWRVDPMTGQRALHTGLDFPSDVGTPIFAAAGGVVVVQEFHPAYGNMVEIDHGNELITRYAHASRVHVKKGDIVKKGQLVGEVGSTGRSTGAHLHFEVWLAGVAQNPLTFLNAGNGKLAQRQVAQAGVKGGQPPKP